MKTSNPKQGRNRPGGLKKRLDESRSVRKGREQRQAAEKGQTVGFYAKEIAKRVLNPFHRHRKSAK